MRKDYKIIPKIWFEIDRDSYIFAFLPTIEWQPWRYRYLRSSIICIRWLNFGIGFGQWVRKETYEEWR